MVGKKTLQPYCGCLTHVGSTYIVFSINETRFDYIYAFGTKKTNVLLCNHAVICQSLAQRSQTSDRVSVLLLKRGARS